ncbi:MAG: ribosome small subunit-dependent GTPase A [Clostridiales bacterium]|nr:ribosome small subunit-dependent GTPase A [Clostridiales bacterium]
MDRIGIIMKGIGGFYYVKIGEHIVECKARGVFRKDGIRPTVGDRVKLSENLDLIEEILPRKNLLSRPAIANIDYIGIVLATKNPNPDYLLADKMLIYSCIQDIEPIIIINKIDKAKQTDIDRIIEMYENTGWKIFLVSSLTGEGIEELSHGLTDGITTLAGQSGVGKSSLLNALYPKFNLEVGSVSQRLGRGRHTTRYVELLPLPSGGMIADTPGFSSVAIQNIEDRVVANCYPEFVEYNYGCRFGSKCIHVREPGCSVKENVDKGNISRHRYERYIKILEEIEERGVDYR